MIFPAGTPPHTPLAVVTSVSLVAFVCATPLDHNVLRALFAVVLTLAIGTALAQVLAPPTFFWGQALLFSSASLFMLASLTLRPA